MGITVRGTAVQSAPHLTPQYIPHQNTHHFIKWKPVFMNKKSKHLPECTNLPHTPFSLDTYCSYGRSTVIKTVSTSLLVCWNTPPVQLITVADVSVEMLSPANSRRHKHIYGIHLTCIFPLRAAISFTQLILLGTALKMGSTSSSET